MAELRGEVKSPRQLTVFQGGEGQDSPMGAGAGGTAAAELPRGGGGPAAAGISGADDLENLGIEVPQRARGVEGKLLHGQIMFCVEDLEELRCFKG